MSPTPTHRSKGRDAADLVDGWLQVVSTRGHPPREDVHPDHAGYGLDLVLLDMDGTLTRGVSSWELVHHAFGVDNETNWQRFQAGGMTDEEFMRRDIALWGGDREVHVEEVERALATLELMDNARAFVQALHARGVATCILSGGLDLAARRVCEATGIDMFVANGLRLKAQGHLVGEALCYVRLADKNTPTRDLLAHLDVRPERAAAVGNSAFDVGMFEEVGFGVAFAPVDDGVRKGANAIVDGEDMLDVLPHLDAYAKP